MREQLLIDSDNSVVAYLSAKLDLGMDWYITPQDSLDGEIPAVLIKSGRGLEVIAVLESIGGLFQETVQ